jgi:F-type H+-transporting ATPase subunit delta
MAESADITARDARTAAEMEADVGAERIADIYAAALLGAAEKAGTTDAVMAEFDALMREVLAAFPRFEAVLSSALVSHEEKLALLDRVFAGKLSPLLLTFLKVVSRHGRLDCLWAVHRQAHVLFDRLRGRVRVRLVTAAPVDDAAAGRIAEKIRAMVGGEPLMEREVDPALIGGAVVHVGDTVYDGSIANQLLMVRQEMIDRSAHEIQSRRDRFRYPT